MAATQEKIFPFFKRVAFPVKLKLLFLWGVGAAVLLASFYVIFTIITFKDDGPVRPRAQEVTEEGQVNEVPAFTYSYNLSPVSIALVDRRKVRTGYAQFNMVLDCPSEKSVHELSLHRAKIMSALNELAVQFNFEDFQSPAGFARFKNAYRDILKGMFHENAPRNIVIRDWLVN